MSMKHNNGGFTLIEFVVTIAVASMITLAATSMLLLGLRIYHKSAATAGQLNTVSMLYSVMDTIASDNETDCTRKGDSIDTSLNQDWIITSGSAAIEYDDSTDTISLNGTPFAGNIKSSNANLDSNGLLIIYIKTDQNHDYTFSVYCRKGSAEAG